MVRLFLSTYGMVAAYLAFLALNMTPSNAEVKKVAWSDWQITVK